MADNHSDNTQESAINFFVILIVTMVSLIVGIVIGAEHEDRVINSNNQESYNYTYCKNNWPGTFPVRDISGNIRCVKHEDDTIFWMKGNPDGRAGSFLGLPVKPETK